jgi:hypothetical protein
VLQNLPAGSLQSLYDLAEAGDLMERTSKKYAPTKEQLVNIFVDCYF